MLIYTFFPLYNIGSGIWYLYEHDIAILLTPFTITGLFAVYLCVAGYPFGLTCVDKFTLIGAVVARAPPA